MLDEMPASTPIMFEAATDNLTRPIVVRGEPDWWVGFDAAVDRILVDPANDGPNGEHTAAQVVSSRSRRHVAVRQVVGTSTVALFAPSDVGWGFDRPTSRNSIGAAVKATSNHEELLEQIRVNVAVEPHSATLEPGQTLFVPPKWWLIHASPPGSWSLKSSWTTPRRGRATLYPRLYPRQRHSHQPGQLLSLLGLTKGPRG